MDVRAWERESGESASVEGKEGVIYNNSGSGREFVSRRGLTEGAMIGLSESID